MAKQTKRTKREENYGTYVFRRTRKGKEEIFARVGYYDKNGVWRYKYEAADTEEDAKEKAKKIIKLYRKRGSAYIDGAQMNFESLADWYKEKYVFPPIYENGQQTGGLRSYKNVRTQIERLKKERFGAMKIARITEEVLEQYKNKRKNVDKVKPAAYNRDLEMLRAIFNKAVKQGWLEESPFERAENLIRKSLEARRKVTVTSQEERIVFDVARRMDNIYLYPLVVTLRDSGARPSEIFPYAAYGVDLDELPRKIHSWMDGEVTSEEEVFLPLCWFQLFKVEFQAVPLVSLKSRQIEFRFGTMTARLRRCLLDLWEKTDKDPIKLVFPFKSIKKQWAKVREEAALYQTFVEVKSSDDPKEKLKSAFGEKAGVFLELVDRDIEELTAKAKEIKAELLTPSRLSDLRIRDWRRVWRSRADQAGVPEQTAQRLLGHKLLQTSYHYNEADLEAVVGVSRTLDEVNLANENIN